MNRYQQITLALIAPFIIFFLGYGYITNFVKVWPGIESADWNNFNETWLVWLISFIVLGFIEYIIFSINVKKI